MTLEPWFWYAVSGAVWLLGIVLWAAIIRAKGLYRADAAWVLTVLCVFWPAFILALPLLAVVGAVAVVLEPYWERPK